MAISDRFETGQLTRSSSGVSSRSRDRLLFVFTVGAFTVVSLCLGMKLNLYIDELYSLHTTSRGFAYALQQSLGFEQQPPLFFLALTAWRTISMSDAFARLFPVECAIVTLFVVRSFAKRRLAGIPEWVAPLAFALNPVFLWAALDVRVYALVILISAILMTSFFDAFVDDGASLPKYGAFTLAAIAALYTQYFIGSLFVGFGLTLLLQGPRRKFGPFVACMAVVGVACLPLLGAIRNEFNQATVVSAMPPLALAARMLTATMSFVYPHSWIGPVARIINFAYVAIVLFSLAILAREIRSSPTLQRLVTIVACITAFFLLVILAARAPLEMPRHIATLFVPIVLLALASIGTLRDSVTRRRAVVAYIAVLVLCAAADDMLSFRPPLSKVGDWQRVGDFLNAHVRSGEPIAVFDTEDVLGVRHYYRGASRIVALPREQSFSVFDRRDFAIRSPQELAAVFPAAAREDRRAWLVFGVSVCPIVELGASCSILNSYVDSHFNVLEQRNFDGTVVRKLQAK